MQEKIPQNKEGSENKPIPPTHIYIENNGNK